MQMFAKRVNGSPPGWKKADEKLLFKQIGWCALPSGKLLLRLHKRNTHAQLLHGNQEQICANLLSCYKRR